MPTHPDDDEADLDEPTDDDDGGGGALIPADPNLALGDLLGGGGLDLGGLMEQASQLQAQMASAQEAAASTLVEGVAGGGAVRVEATGVGEFRSVRIEPAAVDPSDVGMLEDLVLAALHDVVARMDELRAQSMGGLGDLFGGD